jgi:hypothetical protein
VVEEVVGAGPLLRVFEQRERHEVVQRRGPLVGLGELRRRLARYLKIHAGLDGSMRMVISTGKRAMKMTRIGCTEKRGGCISAISCI